MTASTPTTAHEECPRFSHCSVNKCPLHIDFLKLGSSPEDRETKCTLAKTIRKRLGLKWNLPNKGLTQREMSSAKLWANLPETEKRAKIENIQKISLITRLSKKGYTISPKRKDNSETHIENTKLPEFEALGRGI